jgi:acyl-CoA reductase-like NAD-dependent aldehyde dehydrogenase
VYDAFLAALTEAVTKAKTGYDPDDEDILYGPINNPNQLRHISEPGQPRTRACTPFGWGQAARVGRLLL